MYLLWSIIFSVVALSAQETVKLTVFYESLCPWSERFIANQLYPTYKLLGSEFLNVELYPFSEIEKVNEHEWKYECQHGERECFANQIQACALGLNKTTDDAIRFIGCVMSTNSPSKKSANRQCAKSNNISWKNIKACINSDQGKIFMEEIYNTTKKLDHELDYVPHIIINDVVDDTLEISAKRNLFTTLCNLYKTEKPKVCTRGA